MDTINGLPREGKCPCLFTISDTTGEKDFEEFYTENEVLNMNRFQDLGIPNIRKSQYDYVANEHFIAF